MILLHGPDVTSNRPWHSTFSGPQDCSPVCADIWRWRSL